MRQVNFSIDDRVYATLEKLGEKQGYKATSYAKMLFEAALAARLGIQPDADLDAQIAAAVVLHGARQDTSLISRAVKLSEPTIMRIIDRWREERLESRP